MSRSGKHVKPTVWRLSPLLTVAAAVVVWVAVAAFLMLSPGTSRTEVHGSVGDPGRERPQAGAAVPEAEEPQTLAPDATPVDDASPAREQRDRDRAPAPTTTAGATSAAAAGGGSGGSGGSTPEPAPSDSPPGKAKGHDKDHPGQGGHGGR